MRKPSEILSYEQFVEEMNDPGFQARMHYGIDILLEYVEKDPSYLTGDDERIVKYWLQYYQHQGGGGELKNFLWRGILFQGIQSNDVRRTVSTVCILNLNFY
jgi:hypothetical protein